MHQEKLYLKNKDLLLLRCAENENFKNEYMEKCIQMVQKRESSQITHRYETKISIQLPNIQLAFFHRMVIRLFSVRFFPSLQCWCKSSKLEHVRPTCET